MYHAFDKDVLAKMTFVRDARALKLDRTESKLERIMALVRGMSTFLYEVKQDVQQVRKKVVVSKEFAKDTLEEKEEESSSEAESA